MNKQQIYEWIDYQIETILRKPKDCWKKEFVLLQDTIKIKIMRASLE